MTIEAGPDELYTTVAGAGDAEAITELVNSAYRGDSSRRGWTTEADLLGGQRIDVDGVLEIVGAPGQAILVLRARRGPFACAHVRKASPTVAYVGMLTVRPALQGSGIGRQMLAAAESYARVQYGAEFMEMTVFSVREELLAWYERRGYKPSGEIRPFDYDGERLGLPTRDDLEFLVLRRRIAG
jgi:GNAT superfamily N-acetyltransferase